jgi:hypothetical protein
VFAWSRGVPFSHEPLYYDQETGEIFWEINKRNGSRRVVTAGAGPTGGGGGSAVLPPATATQLGGIKASSSVAVAADGTATVPAATTLQLGGVKASTSLVVGPDGTAKVVPHFTQSGAHASERTVENKLKEIVSITDFGAVGDGVFDCTAAIQAGLDYLNSKGGGTLWIPDGRFRKLDVASTQLIVHSNTTIRGNGDSSVIFFDDRPTVPRSGNDLFMVRDAENVTFESFRVEGTLLTHLVETNQKQCFAGRKITNLAMRNVTIEKVRFMATSFEEVENATIAGCKFRHVLRDGARCANSQNVFITDNLFQWVADDAVAVHSIDSAAVPGSHVIVSDNILEGCQGIKALGGKSIVIANNVIRRCVRNPILVGLPASGPEGRSPVFAVDISNNVITDAFGDHGTNSYILIINEQSQNKVTGNLQPGLSSPPYSYNYLNALDPTKVVVAETSIKISDNILMRTLPDGVHYTAWGYGRLFDQKPGLFSDPLITEATFQTHGIEINGPASNVQITNNQISGMGKGMSAILLTADTINNHLDLRNIVISGNIINDCPGIGVNCSNLGSGQGAKHVIVSSNLFDLDPFFRAPSHNADNTWTSLDVNAIAIQNTFGVAIGGNTFKNTAQTGIGGNNPETFANIAYSDFTAPFNTATNKGVRSVPSASVNVIVPIDGDPTSPTFGQILNPVLSRNHAMPSSGRYLMGHRVWCDSPSLIGTAGSHYFVLGWLRITTGSNHVLNTDWVEMRVPVGT